MRNAGRRIGGGILSRDCRRENISHVEMTSYSTQILASTREICGGISQDRAGREMSDFCPSPISLDIAIHLGRVGEGADIIAKGM